MEKLLDEMCKRKEVGDLTKKVEFVILKNSSSLNTSNSDIADRFAEKSWGKKKRVVTQTQQWRF